MQRLAIVLNPNSGKNETSKSEITKLFDAKRFSSEYFDITQGLAKLEKSIRKYDPQTVVAVGGDGTVNAVANIVAKLNVPMGVLPAGTLNHFAKDLDLPIELAAAAAIISDGKITAVDYATINDHAFVNNCNLGAYPAMVRKRDKLGSIPNKWLAAVVAAVQVRLKHRKQKYELKVDNKLVSVRAGSLFIGNNPYKLKGAQFTTRPSLAKGVLQLVIVKTGRIRHLIRILIGFIIKRPHEKVSQYEAQTIEIKSTAKQQDVAVDGEVIRLEVPLIVNIHPKGLRVYKK